MRKRVRFSWRFRGPPPLSPATGVSGSIFVPSYPLLHVAIIDTRSDGQGLLLLAFRLQRPTRLWIVMVNQRVRVALFSGKRECRGPKLYCHYTPFLLKMQACVRSVMRQCLDAFVRMSDVPSVYPISFQPADVVFTYASDSEWGRRDFDRKEVCEWGVWKRRRTTAAG